MKIEMHPSLKVAHNVVKSLEKILPQDIAKDCDIKSWSNGREQGLCVYYSAICRKNVKICIAENRSSDDIVILFGNTSEFHFQTNQPSEEVYSRRSYFGFGDYKGAAKFIKDFLING